jgi:hypothetical protein
MPASLHGSTARATGAAASMAMAIDTGIHSSGSLETGLDHVFRTVGAAESLTSAGAPPAVACNALGRKNAPLTKMARRGGARVGHAQRRVTHGRDHVGRGLRRVVLREARRERAERHLSSGERRRTGTLAATSSCIRCVDQRTGDKRALFRIYPASRVHRRRSARSPSATWRGARPRERARRARVRVSQSEFLRLRAGVSVRTARGSAWSRCARGRGEPAARRRRRSAGAPAASRGCCGRDS